MNGISELAMALLDRDGQPQPLPEPLPLDALPTPALVLDRAVLQSNINKMADHLAGHNKGFRPHAKTHKCPQISRLQLEAGAVGVCVAKLGEAAALMGGGVEEILVTSPVASPAKAQVVAALAGRNQSLRIVVDSELGLDVLAAALPPDTQLGVLVDLDVEMGRTGVRDQELVYRLLDRIAGDERLRFDGVQHYAGHLMHVADFAERRTRSLASWDAIAERVSDLSERGFTPGIVTGCGTGTYDIDIEAELVTDLQVGSYIFMDEEYRQVLDGGGQRFEYFDVSLTVACTGISQPTSRTMTVDGGYKAFASDSVMPVTDDFADVSFRFAGDEHGVLILPKGQQALQLGQVVRFVTPHCDPTVNLHDYYWVLEEDGLVHNRWPITARGCSW